MHYYRSINNWPSKITERPNQGNTKMKKSSKKTITSKRSPKIKVIVKTRIVKVKEGLTAFRKYQVLKEMFPKVHAKNVKKGLTPFEGYKALRKHASKNQ